MRGVHRYISFNADPTNQPSQQERVMSLIPSSKSVIKSIAAASVLSAVLMSGAGSANAYGQKAIDAEQAREAARIEQGRYNGNLTRREYRDLKAEQDSIAAMERRANADGHISKREYRSIHEAQNNAARHIAQENNDGQKSWYRRWLYNHRY
jgi:hypothetical protein